MMPSFSMNCIYYRPFDVGFQGLAKNKTHRLLAAEGGVYGTKNEVITRKK